MPFGLGKKKPQLPPTVSDEAPGWDAIDAALAHFFPGQEPLHRGANRLPGQDASMGCAPTATPTRGFITYGLSELFIKESEDPTTTGFGFELTVRVPAIDTEPPAWPRVLLGRLGSYVWSSGRGFAPGHRSGFGEPLTGGPPTQLTAAAFATDPSLARS
jgi:suppressor of fused-like protein